MSQHPPDDPGRPYFATAAKGTEGALRAELQELGIARVKATRGGVYFGGAFANALRACLLSRIALRILFRQASFPAGDPAALYAGVREIPWERVLDASRTLCVDAHLHRAPVTHSIFAAQRTKDAIVDRLRAREGVRPSVDRRDPDVRVALHWVGERASVLLDVSAGPLHARGYRQQAGEAPLRENLAAAMLRLSGWDRRLPLIDPMCGSGTIAIEAAQWARGLAPAADRPLGCERWASHGAAERAELAALREQARAGQKAAAAPIAARDRDPRALSLARRNAARAGVTLDVARADVRELRCEHDRAFVVTNPPYGERLSQSCDARELAEAFRRLRGHRVCVLARDRELLRAMRRDPVLEHALWNGPLECRLLCWDL